MTDEFGNVYTKLNEEIKKEEESHSLKAMNDVAKNQAQDNIENFKKSTKPKRKLKNKIIAFCLGAAAVAGVSIYTNTPEYQTKKYEKEVIKAEQTVEENISVKVSSDMPTVAKDFKTQMMTFDDVIDNYSKVHIYGHYYSLQSDRYMNSETIYKLAENYYNELVDAESESTLKYFEVLNECMEHLEYEETKFSDYNFDYKFTENEAKNFNEFLNSGDKIYLGTQVATLPYFVGNETTKSDVVNEIYHKSFDLKTISIYEVNSNGELIELNGENFILTTNLDFSKQYKILEKTVRINLDWNFKGLSDESINKFTRSNLVKYIIDNIKNNNTENITCDTISVREVNKVTQSYLNQTEGLEIIN